jgi:thiol-disulfide isomerase/thioredoxin
VSRLRAALAVVAVLLALGACGGNSVGGQDQAGSAGSTNTIERIAAAKRSSPLTVSGTTLSGSTLSTASWRGQVVVLNYWGSWCGPCVEETPDLKAAWGQLQGKGVQFLGLDSQEGAQTGQAFMTANGLTYPSLRWDGGRFLIQLKGQAPAAPTTIVLDQQGRLAARVLSKISTSTLVGLVQDVQAETSKAAAG